MAQALPSAQRGSFASVLDTKIDDIERPKAMPVGQYVFMVKGQPEFIESREKKTPGVKFTLNVIQPIEETVDADSLQEWLTKKDGTERNLQEATQSLTFWLTEGSAWGVKDFIRHCGVEADDMTLRQAIAETAGCQVIGTVKHRSNDDGTATFAFIDSTAPLATE